VMVAPALGLDPTSVAACAALAVANASSSPATRGHDRRMRMRPSSHLESLT
jgi:hypothetical protein